VKFRLRGLLPDDFADRLLKVPGVSYWRGGERGGPTVSAPVNAGWLVKDLLVNHGFTTPENWHVTVPEAAVLAHSQQHDLAWAQEQVSATELHPWVWDWFKPFQREAVTFGLAWGGGNLWEPTGAGKTGQSVAWGLAGHGPLIIVTRGGARRAWIRALRFFADVRPFALEPQRRKADPTLRDYLRERESDGRRIILVVGWESMTLHLSDVLAVGPVSVVFDESHLGKAWKRARWIPRADGSGVDPRDLNNRSSSAEKLARACDRSLNTTATVLADRRIDLWAQLDLVNPGGWGRTSTKYKFRYCDARDGDFGGLDCTGKSNTAELVKRINLEAFAVDYETSHGQLPPLRTQVFWIQPAYQDRHVGAFAADLKQAMRRGDKHAVAEIRLALAASKKRTEIALRVAETLKDGGKVVVFTGREKDTYLLGAAIAKAWAKADKSATVKVWGLPVGKDEDPDYRESPEGCNVWVAPGAAPMRKRDWIHTLYQGALDGSSEPHPGPCVLVGTGQAWGASLDLHDTDFAAIAHLPWTPEALRQQKGRFHRLGQVRHCLLGFFVAEGTYDDHVAGTLLGKLEDVEAVIGADELLPLADKLRGTEDEDALLDSLLNALCADMET